MPAFQRVFISHSKDDHDGKRFIGLVCSNAGMKTEMVEYSQTSIVDADLVRKAIDGCQALFVMMSKHMVDQGHTRNWIAFEMGIAYSMNKPIFVLENSADHVAFGVPRVDYYILYSDTESAVKALTMIFSSDKVNRFFTSKRCTSEMCKGKEHTYRIVAGQETNYCPYCCEARPAKSD
jgi:hypothetical protein